jgi:hypothetical protein
VEQARPLRRPQHALVCSPQAQSVIGGVAHLLNFDGSDTMSAGYFAQYALNGGNPVAQSIPATEHRRVCCVPRTAALSPSAA